MMEKKRNLIFIYVVIFVTFLALFYSPLLFAASNPIILKYSDPSKEGTARTEAAKDTMLEIEKRTGGRVKHEFYWSESLVKAKDSLEALKAGTCDVGGAPDMVYHPGFFPVWQFSQIMFIGGPDLMGVMKAWNEMARTHPKLKEEIDRQGVKFLGTFGYPTTFICKKPLAELSDFKGLKLRAVGPTAKWLSSIGATAVPLTFYEVTEGLARGVIEGTMGYLYVHVPYKFHDFCKFFTATPVANALIFNTWMNLEAWKRLPPDIQKIYEEAWRDYFPEAVLKHTDNETAKQIKALRDGGVKITNLTPAQYARWKESASNLDDEYVEKMKKIGVDGRKIIADFERLYKKYEKK
ncbi:MAG: TRAP transporter substrate-binding protein DctP [Deltaproteobacteria bacterium]|nr:TRAP transporter substrate-binding protein DctP [Deltaproteobacteria bacterium]